MKKFYVILLAALMYSARVKSQDIHFSQYYASPLTLNPALTANINGDFRVAANYRMQWYTIPTLNSVAPYQTYQVSFDMPILRQRLGNDAFGFGGMFYTDKAGDGALTTFSFMASVAYHKAIDRYGHCRLSFGLQAGVVSEQVNINNLVFESQLNQGGGFFDPTLPNGENYFNNKPIIYPDVNAGALWSQAVKEKFRYYVGFAMDHLSRPDISFYTDEPASRLDYRYNIHLGGEIYLNRDNTLSLNPAFLFMLQGNATEYDPGLALNYEMTDNFTLFGGLWYRVGDAVIPNIGAEYQNFRLGFSYDVNYSTLSTSSHAQGAVELSLVYIHKKEKPGKIRYESYCPLF